VPEVMNDAKSPASSDNADPKTENDDDEEEENDDDKRDPSVFPAFSRLSTECRLALKVGRA
jgi:hypothetical protein